MTGTDIPEAEHHQHQANGELHRETKPWLDDPVEQDDRGADKDDGERVAEAPPYANPCRPTREALASDCRRNRGNVIGISRVPHSEHETERERRPESHRVELATTSTCWRTISPRR